MGAPAGWGEPSWKGDGALGQVTRYSCRQVVSRWQFVSAGQVGQGSGAADESRQDGKVQRLVDLCVDDDHLPGEDGEGEGEGVDAADSGRSLPSREVAPQTLHSIFKSSPGQLWMSRALTSRMCWPVGCGGLAWSRSRRLLGEGGKAGTSRRFGKWLLRRPVT